MTHFYNPSVHPVIKLDVKNTFFIIFLPVMLSFFRSTRAIVIIQSFFAVFIYFQSVHYLYYGVTIIPPEVHEFFVSFHDVVADFGMLSNFMLLSLLPVLFIALFTFLSLHLGRKRIKVSYIWVVLLVVIFFLGITVAKRSDLGQNANRFSNIYKATFKTILYCLTHTLPEAVGWRKVDAMPQYSHVAYKLTNRNKDVQVVFIQGESLTFHNMSLYGYRRDTTPFLDKLSKTPQVRFYKGVPCGPSTDISLPQFYNIIPYPNGILQIAKGTTNLFSMAKSNGFVATFISAQSAMSLFFIKNYLGVKYIDNYGDARFFGADDKNADEKDQVLVNYLQNHVNFAKRNFLVLHMKGDALSISSALS